MKGAAQIWTAPFDMTGFAWLRVPQPRHVEVAKVNERVWPVIASLEYTPSRPVLEPRDTSPRWRANHQENWWWIASRTPQARAKRRLCVAVGRRVGRDRSGSGRRIQSLPR